MLPEGKRGLPGIPGFFCGTTSGVEESNPVAWGHEFDDFFNDEGLVTKSDLLTYLGAFCLHEYSARVFPSNNDITYFVKRHFPSSSHRTYAPESAGLKEMLGGLRAYPKTLGASL